MKRYGCSSCNGTADSISNGLRVTLLNCEEVQIYTQCQHFTSVLLCKPTITVHWQNLPTSLCPFPSTFKFYHVQLLLAQWIKTFDQDFLCGCIRTIVEPVVKNTTSDFPVVINNRHNFKVTHPLVETLLFIKTSSGVFMQAVLLLVTHPHIRNSTGCSLMPLLGTITANSMVQYSSWVTSHVHE